MIAGMKAKQYQPSVIFGYVYFAVIYAIIMGAGVWLYLQLDISAPTVRRMFLRHEMGLRPFIYFLTIVAAAMAVLFVVVLKKKLRERPPFFSMEWPAFVAQTMFTIVMMVALLRVMV
jgi:hypothetical protein